MRAVSSEKGLLCCMPGCPKNWTCDFGFGAMCSEHDAMRHTNGATRNTVPAAGPRSLGTVVPLRPPSRPYAEVDDDDRPF